MGQIRILGTGSYLPEKVLTNDDLVAMGLDTSDDWIVQRTGIRCRRQAADDQATSDLAAEAARRALEAAGMAAADLQLVVVATITPDTCCPAAANWLQAKLGAEAAVTFDVTAACSGFVFALDVARQYLENGTFANALVVAAEVMTRTLDWTDRSTCVFWGDGAGAVVLARADGGPQLVATSIHTDGAGGKDLLLPGGGSSTTPISHASVQAKAHSLKMIEASRSFRVAVRRFEQAMREGAAAAGLPVDRVDWYIPHQANLRMFQYLSKSLSIPMERFYLTLERYGNISSASCAIALDEAVRDGSIRPGHWVCLPVFGGGLTWGCATCHWA